MQIRLKFSLKVKAIVREHKHSYHGENFLVITLHELVDKTAC